MNKTIIIKISVFIALFLLLLSCIPLFKAYSQLVIIEILIGVIILLVGVIISIISALRMKRCEMAPSPVIQNSQELEVIDLSVVQTLAMLQKNGRLVDFLREDISGYSDEQVGAAVRSIHKGCIETLNEYVVIEPVIDKIEGAEVTIEGDNYSPSSIRLTGNVTSKPPYKGILQHCGWRVTKTQFPKRVQGQGDNIVQPAEIEIP
ncbi:MAG: DUF2760 domain-containing protein [Nitrospirae bacterium]|nr:DUF2760 domain-containing protein [Nitrospirota bacterium]